MVTDLYNYVEIHTGPAHPVALPETVGRRTHPFRVDQMAATGQNRAGTRGFG